ncbi:Chromosomal replication initiator protein DnaA [Streptococcus sp. DD10]|uniref:DnaA/Hda family protein n=1 Tax=Streptococcus sp. DD10 TaxID=1777878 RepID=UPI0007937902|nr:DnaA/Hda family protein [Streptococcus sp. DD10]KXT72325.1 Chromosomal replication initiator protein DnaA [Streptococcus sp. DD10]
MQMNQHGFNENYQFENFTEKNGNEWAKVGALAVVQNLGTLYNPFYLYGQPGAGKTHLIQSVGNQVLKENPNTQVKYISAKDFADECLEASKIGDLEQFRKCYSNLDLLILDDIQALSEMAISVQDELITIFDLLRRQQKQIILSSSCEVDELENFNPKLTLRFKLGLIVSLSLIEK